MERLFLPPKSEAKSEAMDWNCQFIGSEELDLDLDLDPDLDLDIASKLLNQITRSSSLYCRRLLRSPRFVYAWLRMSLGPSNLDVQAAKNRDQIAHAASNSLLTC